MIRLDFDWFHANPTRGIGLASVPLEGPAIVYVHPESIIDTVSVRHQAIGDSLVTVGSPLMVPEPGLFQAVWNEELGIPWIPDTGGTPAPIGRFRGVLAIYPLDDGQDYEYPMRRGSRGGSGTYSVTASATKHAEIPLWGRKVCNFMCEATTANITLSLYLRHYREDGAIDYAIASSQTVTAGGNFARTIEEENADSLILESSDATATATLDWTYRVRDAV